MDVCRYILNTTTTTGGTLRYKYRAPVPKVPRSSPPRHGGGPTTYLTLPYLTPYSQSTLLYTAHTARQAPLEVISFLRTLGTLGLDGWIAGHGPETDTDAVPTIPGKVWRIPPSPEQDGFR